MGKIYAYRQHDSSDCGPTCLRIITNYYDQDYTLDEIKEVSQISRVGVNFMMLSEAAEALGLRTLPVRTSMENLHRCPMPLIAHWRKNHFVVAYKITAKSVYFVDPAHGKVRLSIEDFKRGWVSTESQEGFALLMEPTPNFYTSREGQDKKKKIGLSYFMRYFYKYKFFFVQLFLSFIIGSGISIVIPFLTQALVDKGVLNQDLNFIYLILIAQVVITISQTSLSFLQAWISIHVNTRVNVSVLSDFLSKLMRLPMTFFDSKHIGDILQRMADHERIDSFLKSATMGTIFSMFNLVIYGGILAFYNAQILLIFLIGSALYVIWIVLFLRIRRNLDYKNFALESENQSKMVSIIYGMQTLKLHNAEKHARWDWERLQARLFRLGIKSMIVGQAQSIGTTLISQLQSITITIIIATKVVEGELTLGSMVATQYILGQMIGPISQILGLVTSAQDAKIGLERLGEVLNKEDEDEEGSAKLTQLPEDRTIRFNQVSYKYPGTGKGEYALKDIDVDIPSGKVTAIVGSSGSGKTTMLKLIMKYMRASSGDVMIGPISIDNIKASYLRSRLGVVVQDGYIFSDSIANNIALGVESVNRERLTLATDVANISDFINSLPLGFNTKIGEEGHGLSMGQMQRLFIARAIYKDPSIILFDEATNSLDATNEKVIMNNLRSFFKGRTVVIVAHRLSTVMDADKIIVLEKGEVIEVGTHKELVARKDMYYNLVRNQLELGT